jgi:ribosomal protein L16 Arg81 hydroxylase
MKNPPAFPPMHDPNTHEFGMTLRDYFAAKAMQAYSSDADWRHDMTPTDTAFAAYTQADAMLKARGA